MKPANEDLLNRLTDANAVLTSGFENYEEDLESDSFIARAALPHRRHSPRNFWVWEMNRFILGANAGSSSNPTSPILRGRDFSIPLSS